VLRDRSCATHVVLADVKGRARSPNGTALKAHLTALSPRLSLGGSKTQALDAAVEVRVRCSQPCHVRATGRLRLGRRGFGLEPSSADLGSGQTHTLAVRIPSRARRAAAAALDEQGPVSARITVVATAGSMSSQRRRSVKLR
jgi:hypothetical protein